MSILINDIISTNIFIKVFDISGKLVYEKKKFSKDKYQTELINFSGYAKGVYIINIKYDDKDFTRKIIIQ